MSQSLTPHPTRDMSTLVGTSKTLERAISGLQMNTQRLIRLLGEEPQTPALSEVISSLNKLTTDDRELMDAILSHRTRTKRKTK